MLYNLKSVPAETDFGLPCFTLQNSGAWPCRVDLLASLFPFVRWMWATHIYWAMNDTLKILMQNISILTTAWTLHQCRHGLLHPSVGSPTGALKYVKVNPKYR